jgi:GDP-4-dehydro-6-deoxy-D-mannose reductase
VKVLVTGATGFVGRWLIRELEAAGHEAVGAPPSTDLDVTDGAAVAALVAEVGPDAVAHLAGVSFSPDARREPERALEINEGGTRAVLTAVAHTNARMPVLVVSSSDVYGHPRPQDLPLQESAPLLADQAYGRSKLAQERVALEIGAAHGIPVVVVRAFNHTGPGQRPEFVVPALAARIVAARESGNRTIRAGNVDVRRDFSDVRDVVRAYRLLLEDLGSSRLPAGPLIYNVASGRAVAIRELVHMLAVMAGVEVEIDVDPALVRQDDPPEICGDASRIAGDVGWRPLIPLDVTLRDVLADVRMRASARPPRHPRRSPPSPPARPG